jgi:hypothetical protein
MKSLMGASSREQLRLMAFSDVFLDLKHQPIGDSQAAASCFSLLCKHHRLEAAPGLRFNII